MSKKTKGLWMASVRLISSAEYQPVDKDLNLQIEVAQIYAKHKKSFEEFNFGASLLALMRLARNRINDSGAEKRTWVLHSYQKMVELAYENDSLKSQIALASGASLLEAIYTISARVSLFSKDVSAFYTYFTHDTDVFTARLITKQAPLIRQKDIIPMIEVIYWMKFYYLHNSKLEDLADAALAKAFPNEVPEDGVYAGIISKDERELYAQLIPIILALLEEVSSSYISLSRPKKSSQDDDCCSSCLCQ